MSDLEQLANLLLVGLISRSSSNPSSRFWAGRCSVSTALWIDSSRNEVSQWALSAGLCFLHCTTHRPSGCQWPWSCACAQISRNVCLPALSTCSDGLLHRAIARVPARSSNLAS